MVRPLVGTNVSGTGPSYLPEIAERAIREGAVTKGSTTAQSLFNYERTGYTGPNRSQRDLPPTLLLREWTRDGG